MKLIQLNLQQKQRNTIKIDELVKQQINVKSQISILEKEDILSKEATVITKDNMFSFMSKKIDIPLEDLTQSEKVRLRGLMIK